MLSYCLSQSGLSSHLSLALMCLLGTHSALKVTSAALTSACFPWVSGRKGPIVFSARQLRDSTYLAIFSLVQSGNNENNSVQKCSQVFWHELCSSNSWNLLSYHCQVGQILVRARSSLSQVQGQLSLGW